MKAGDGLRFGLLTENQHLVSETVLVEFCAEGEILRVSVGVSDFLNPLFNFRKCGLNGSLGHGHGNLSFLCLSAGGVRSTAGLLLADVPIIYPMSQFVNPFGI